MDLFRSSAVQEFCSSLHVPKLANDYNLPLALASCAFFFLVQAFSSRISPRLFPNHFAKFSGKTKLDWDFHATGWIHSLIITPVTLYLIFNPSPELVGDPIFGYATLEGTVFAFSGGYFAYDLLVSLWYVKINGWPFVLHAVACCFIFFKAFTPFLMGVGSMFLIWEFSTMFLHIHWWLDKLNMTGSIFQLVNGVLLIASFFGARIAYGGYMTFVLWRLLDDPRINPALRWGFRAANIALNGLNWTWFRLMILALLKRFNTRKAGKAGSGEAAEKGKKEL